MLGLPGACALALIAVLGIGCGSAPKPGREPHLEFGLSDFRDIPLGSRIAIAGGSSEGDVGPIVVYADSAPDGRFRRIAITRLDRNGAFKLFVRPDRNTRYRVETPKIPNASGGKVLDVYVQPRVKLTPVLVGPTRAQLIDVAQMHRGARPIGARVYFYLRRLAARRYRLLGSALASPIGHDKVRAVFEFSLPRPRHGDQVIVCTRRGYARDMGRPAARIAACGRSMIRSPQLGFRANQ